MDYYTLCTDDEVKRMQRFYNQFGFGKRTDPHVGKNVAVWLAFIDGFSAAMLSGQEKNFLDFSVPNDKGQVDCYKVTLTFNQFRQLVLGKAIVNDKGEYAGVCDQLRQHPFYNSGFFSFKYDRLCVHCYEKHKKVECWVFHEVLKAWRNADKGQVGARIDATFCPIDYDLTTRKAVQREDN